MKYSQIITFTGWKELEEEIFNNLKLYGLKEGGSITKPIGEEPQLSILGKIPPIIKGLIDVKGELSDYEGIDDATKKISHVFPLEICSALLVDILGFDGRFIEVPSKVQDPTSGEVSKDLIYISDNEIKSFLNEQISERIETAVNLIDFESDDKEYIASTILECFMGICEDIGNKNLCQEVESKFLDI